MVLRRSSADCGASAPARTASSSASTSYLFTDSRLRFICNYLGFITGLSVATPGLHGGIDDPLDGNAVFDGAGMAVFVLGLRVSDDAVERACLHTNFAVGRSDGRVRAIENATLFGAGADTQGGGLAKEQLFKAGRVGGAAEDGDEGAEAALFHDDGGGHGVERAMLERELDGVRYDLRAQVVDGALEDGNIPARYR